MNNVLSILRQKLKPKTKRRNAFFSSPPRTVFQKNISKKLGIPLAMFPSPMDPKYRKKMMILLHPNKNPLKRMNAEIYFKKL